MYSKIKKSSSVLAIVLALAMVLSAFSVLPELKASADAASGDFSQFLTKITLTVAQSGSQPAQNIELTKDMSNIPTLQIQDGTKVDLSMDFILPDTDKGTIVKSTTYTVQLPNVFKFQDAGYSGTFKSSTKVDYADWTIDKNGLLTVIFRDNADNFDTRSGGFGASSSFSASNLGTTDPKVITFQIGGGTVVLPVDVIVAPVAPAISKTGTYNNGIITWTVTVKSGHDAYNKGLKNVVVTDTLSGNPQTFNNDPTWGGVSVGSGTDGSATPYYEQDAIDVNKITFHLGDMGSDETKDIVFTTTATDKDFIPTFPATFNPKYSNKAVLGADGTSTASLPPATAEVNGTGFNTWIKKGVDTAGVVTDADNKRIQSIPWTVTVNPDGGIVPAGADVKDTLQKYLSLNASTIKLDGTPISTTPNGEGISYSTNTDVNGIQTVTVHFANQITGSRVLTFTTNVDQAYYTANNNPFTNTATLAQGGNSKSSTTSPGVGDGSNVIKKSGTGYDAASHLATWTIQVNNNSHKVAITNPVVTDTIGDHQKFSFISAKQNGVDIGLTEKTGSTTPSLPYYELGTDGNGKQTVTVHLKDFNGTSDLPVVITLVTEVTDKDYYAGNNTTQSVSNSASLTSDNGISGTAPTSQKTPSTVIAKTSSGYNYDTKTLAWTVTVNQNKMDMTNATVTDTLPDGLGLTGVTVNGASLGMSGTPKYTLSGQNLTIYLGDISKGESSPQKTIQITTEILPAYLASHNGNLTFYNTAKLTTTIDGFDYSVDSNQAQQNVTHSVVEKSGQFTGSTGSIAWKVLINKNQIPASGLLPNGTTSVTLTDQLQDGLELDSSTVKLYNLTANGDGTWTRGVEITLDPAKNILYNPQTRLFTFTFPSSTDFSKAYELDFVTDVTKTEATDYTNSVTLNGVKSETDNQAHQTLVSVSAASGWGMGTPRGQVTITKQDKNTGTPLSDTEFTLYRTDSPTPVRTKVTDANGQAVFDNLKQNVSYTIKETKSKAGYQMDSIPWTFTLDATNYNSLPTQTFQDSPIPVNPGGGTPGGNTPSSSETSSVTSSTSSVVSSPSSNPNENIGDDDVGKAGASSKPVSKNPNENIGDDDVGKAGGNPKTGEDRSYLPILLSVMLAAAVLLVLNLAAARRRKNH